MDAYRVKAKCVSSFDILLSFQKSGGRGHCDDMTDTNKSHGIVKLDN
jgi:hypothetical protein